MGGIKITKDTFINVPNDCSFLIINNNKKSTNQPKMTAKMIWKQEQDMKTFIWNILAVLGERSQPAESKGNNPLPVLAFQSKCNEEVKHLVLQGICCSAMGTAHYFC